MAKADAPQRPRQVLRLQQLATAPTTADEAARTIEMVVATETPVDGLVLRCEAGAVEYGPAPVPVLMNHANNTSEMAGRLLSIRFERAQLVAVAQFTDAPAAEQGWQLARAGCAVSVGATFSPDAIEPGRGGSPDVVNRWRLRESSLVAVGADPMATTRSAPDLKTNHAPEGQTMTAQIKPEASEAIATPTASEIRKAREVQRKLDNLLTIVPAEHHEQIRQLAERDGFAAARDAGLDLAAAEQAKCPTQARSYDASDDWAGRSAATRRTGLEDALLRRLKGDGSAVTTLELLEAVTGRRGRADALVQRVMATSDFPALFAAAGFKLLRERYDAAGTGARLIARRRQSADLRDIHLLGLSEFPAMLKLLEGGEIRYGNFTDRGGSYRVEEYARGVNLTRRALLSDDLDAFGEALSSYGRAIAALEDDLVIAALESGGTGARCMEDNKTLFHADHANTTTETGLDIASLTEAAAKLREAREVGNGRRLNLAPRWLLVSAQYEVQAIQLTSEINATAASDVNPFGGGQLALMPLVDANLSGSHAFVLCDPTSPAAAIEICTGPAVADVQSQNDFETTSVKTRVLADRGLGVRDHRGVVRIPLSS